MRDWTCQRVTAGVKCGHRNPSRYQVCRACAKRRPPRKRPAHLKALHEYTYEDYVAINGGEFCGICGAGPSENRRLDRDHWHSGPNAGRPRGLLCWLCNKKLDNRSDVEWTRRALAYLERAA